jgi:hypothetical protein
MAYTVDFTTVSTVGLESSPVAATLAGLRANEARYFKNKYDHRVSPSGGYGLPGREHPDRLRLLRAVGFKLSEGMEVPAELASRFKFARQKSKLAGTIRGSFFAFKNEY